MQTNEKMTELQITITKSYNDYKVKNQESDGCTQCLKCMRMDPPNWGTNRNSPTGFGSIAENHTPQPQGKFLVPPSEWVFGSVASSHYNFIEDNFCICTENVLFMDAGGL
jgi:hypothetical protein